MKVNVYRLASNTTDKFMSWTDGDGNQRQGFVHNTGTEVFCRGEWLTVYTTPEGEEIWD